MDLLAYIVPWVFASVCVGLGAGYYAARNRGKTREGEIVERERQTTLRMLCELVQSADRINDNMESHNSEIRENAEQVEKLAAPGEMNVIRQALLGHMTELIASNKDLQEDLTCTRYRLEEQAQEIDHVRREARTDELTAVANRKACNEKLHLLIDDWNRQGDPFVLMLADVDQFKRINDSHGHPAGDRVLKSIGHWMKEWVREGDFVGRFGGDEFLVLLPHAELDVGAELAEAIRLQTSQGDSQVAMRGEQMSVSLSIGVAASRKGDTTSSILERVDEALYRSKDLGRNQVQVEQPLEADADLITAEVLRRS